MNPAEARSEEPQLVRTLARLINRSDVKEIIDSQKAMLIRFEKTNEMLCNCNALAVARYDACSKVIRKYSSQLMEMKKDLDSIHRRIRFLKMRLSQNYPEAFAACDTRVNVVEEEEEPKEEQSVNK